MKKFKEVLTENMSDKEFDILASEFPEYVTKIITGLEKNLKDIDTGWEKVNWKKHIGNLKDLYRDLNRIN